MACSLGLVGLIPACGVTSVVNSIVAETRPQLGAAGWDGASVLLVALETSHLLHVPSTEHNNSHY